LHLFSVNENRVISLFSPLGPLSYAMSLDRYFTPKARPASTAAAAAKKLKAPTEKHQEEPAVLGEKLRVLLKETSSTNATHVWLVPGFLALGRQPTERSDPVEFLRANNIRVLVDVSADLRELGSYQTTVSRGASLFIRLSIDSRKDISTADRETLLRMCRALGRAIDEFREAAHRGEPPMAVYLCDSRGGGTAALIGVALIAAMYEVCFAEASLYVSTCWNTKRVGLGAGVTRVFPEGDGLKKAGRLLCNSLRQQPIATSVAVEPSGPVHDAFVAHRVLGVAQALCRFTSLEARLLPFHLPFDTMRPMTVISWIFAQQPPPPPPPPPEEQPTDAPPKPKRVFQRTRDYDDDDAENRAAGRRHRRRKHREDGEDDCDDGARD